MDRVGMDVLVERMAHARLHTHSFPLSSLWAGDNGYRQVSKQPGRHAPSGTDGQRQQARLHGK